MGVVVLHRHHCQLFPTIIVFALLFLLSSSSAASLHRFSETVKETGWSDLIGQKRLGSAPPTCRWKCGKCGPCKAVHVPIQPGQIEALEYYPEAWRCKCGNQIFMP